MLGGFLVGMTSVGSGSLIIIALIALYPGLGHRELVGTDLVQAGAPGLVGRPSATCSSATSSSVINASLLVGSVPGVTSEHT